MRLPAETNRVVQVKYTNPSNRKIAHKVLYLTGDLTDMRFFDRVRESMLLVQNKDHGFLPASMIARDASLAFSGSNQAREGRLVNALAVRGDERRDTLR